jgi:hypothetical protein
MKFESSAFRNGYNVSKEAISFLYVDASSHENKNTNFDRLHCLRWMQSPV